MDVWKWHPEGCLSVSVPFEHSECSRLAFLKKLLCSHGQVRLVMVAGIVGAKGGTWWAELTFRTCSFQCQCKAGKNFLCRMKDASKKGLDFSRTKFHLKSSCTAILSSCLSYLPHSLGYIWLTLLGPPLYNKNKLVENGSALNGPDWVRGIVILDCL